MAKVIITARVMPTSPDVDLDSIEQSALSIVKGKIGDAETRVKRQPIAFGLIAIDITFIWEENLGSPEDILNPLITQIDGVNSFELTDVRRAIG